MTNKAKADGSHPASSSQGILERVTTFVASLEASQAFAYLTIVLLQLKVIWGLWLYHDLTSGDTSSYFVNATLWHSAMRDVFSWSPLYTSFLGSLLTLASDAYVAVILHRLIIVLAAPVLVLAVMRELLNPAIAWFVTAWWALLPIDFNPLYEVHLFAVIPILFAYLAVLKLKSAPGRGLTISVLFLSAVLMRNELLLPTTLFAAGCTFYEFRKAGKQRSGMSIRWSIVSYAIPFCCVLAVCGFFYSRAIDKWPALRAMMERKHTLNICQVYAFGYQQRHSEWTKSPWTDCQDLMVKTFGKPEPTISDALVRNPEPMFEHFLWNASLIPNGLQVLLFDATSGKVDPDYAPVDSESRFALVATCAVLGILILGLWLFYSRGRFLWETYLKPNSWGWFAMLCVASVVLVVMVTQRPRPSYMFSFGILVMAVTGFCLQVIFMRWTRLTRVLRWYPIMVIVLIIMVPPYYTTVKHQPRSLLLYYRMLAPYRHLIHTGDVILTPGFSSELCNYLADSGVPACQGLFYYALRKELESSWQDVLSRNHVKFILVDDGMLQDPSVIGFLASAQSRGWETLARENVSGKPFQLLTRSGP